MMRSQRSSASSVKNAGNILHTKEKTLKKVITKITYSISMKKFFVLAALSIVVFSGCKFWPFGGEILTETALPKDSEFVVTIDHSDGDQVKRMKKLFDMLPDYGIGDLFEEDFLEDESLKKSGLDYKKDILPILEGDFKISLAVDFSKLGKEEGVVISVYTDEVSKMNNFLEKKKESGKFFYDKDGDIFVIAFTQMELDAGLKALKDGTGFSTDEDFKNASKNSKGNLGYVYFEMGDNIKEFIANGDNAEIFERLNLEFGATKNIYMELVAKEDGFAFGGLGNLIADKELIAKNMPYFGKKLSLFDKVPLENPILYTEIPGMGQYLESFLPTVTEFFGISEDEIRGIFESNFSFAVGDSGEKYPTMSFYLDVDPQYVNAAKKMIGAIDTYGTEIMKEFEEILGVSGAINKNTIVVKGGGLYKLYVDFDKIPAELLANFGLISGLDVKKMNLELYYGLTGDNVLTVAFYPQFDKVYGEKIVGKDKDVVAAIDSVGNSPFYAFFFSPEKLINFVDTNYYKIAKDNGLIGDDSEKYYELVKNTMQTLKHFVSIYSMPEDDQILFNSFLKFQKIEKDKALEKVKEGK